MVLNWKVFEHYESNPVLAKVYQDLWVEINDYLRDTLKGEALDYYYRTTD